MRLRQFKIAKSITNRGEESLGKYLRDISRFEMITFEEEIRLARLIREGDESAVDKLTKANLRFVVSVAKQFQGQGLSIPDLINEGNIGLITAARKFDETKGFRFISYAVWWIRQYMLRAITDQGKLVRIPVHKAGEANRVKKAYTVLEQDLEREPTAEELAESLELETRDVVRLLSHQTAHVSFDAPVSGAEEGCLLDVMANPDSPLADSKLVFTDSLNIELRRSLSSLTRTQCIVVCYLYGIGADRAYTLEEIAEKLELSRERIRQIKNKALSVLKESAQANRLRTFLAA